MTKTIIAIWCVIKLIDVLQSEEEHTRGKLSVEKLEKQLQITKDSLQQLQTEYETTQTRNKELIQSLNKEKVLNLFIANWLEAKTIIFR